MPQLIAHSIFRRLVLFVFVLSWSKIAMGQDTLNGFTYQLTDRVSFQTTVKDVRLVGKSATYRVGRTNERREILYTAIWGIEEKTKHCTSLLHNNETKELEVQYFDTIGEPKALSAEEEAEFYQSLWTYAKFLYAENYTLHGRQQYYRKGKIAEKYPYIDIYYEWNGIDYEEVQEIREQLKEEKRREREEEEWCEEEEEENILVSIFSGMFENIGPIYSPPKNYTGKMVRLILVHQNLHQVETTNLSTYKRPRKTFKVIKSSFDDFVDGLTIE